MVLSLSNMWKRKLLKKAESASEPETHCSFGGSTLDRRSFLRGGACIVAGAVAGIKVANLVDEGVSGAVELTPSAPSDSAYEETPIIDTATSNNTARSVAKVTSEPEDDLRPSNKHQDSTLLTALKNPIQWYENDFTNPGQSYWKSIGQGVLAVTAGQGISVPLELLGVPTGNADMRELYSDPEFLLNLDVTKFMLSTSVLAPVTEETVFRFAPAAALNLIGRRPEKGQTDFIPALLTSAVFAQMHNAGVVEPTLPVQQFAMGMANWSINRTNGTPHAIAAHSAVNTVAAGLTSVLVLKKRRDLPKNQSTSTDFKDAYIHNSQDLPALEVPVQPSVHVPRLTARQEFEKRVAALLDDDN